MLYFNVFRTFLYMLYFLVKNLALLTGFGDTYICFYNLHSGINTRLDEKMDWKKKLKFVAITAAFAVLILIVLTNVFKMTRVSEKDFQTYSQGLSYLNKGDFENAYFNFSNVSKNSAIYEIALLRQGLCADELNDFETAIKKYRLFIEKYPESLFVQKVYYALAQNYFRAKDYTKAEKTFNDIKRFFKDSEYKTASNYYLGMINSQKISDKVKEIQKYNKNEDKALSDEKSKYDKEILELKQKSKTYFAAYLEEAPEGRFALECAKEIENLQAPLTQKEYYLVGRAYFKNNYHTKAFQNLNKSYMSSSWGYLSEIYRYQGNYKKSRDIFEHNYALYSKNIEDKELQNFLQNYALSYPVGVKAGWYNLLSIAQKSGAKQQDFILYKLTKLESNDIKKQLYEKIYKDFPKGQYASDALANLFWDAYLAQDYHKAFSLGLIHIREYQGTIAAPKVLFWMGKLAEKQGNLTEAKGFYQRILENYPDDYYAFRASKHLSYNRNTGWKTKSSHRLPEKTGITKLPFKHTGISDDNISLINIILKLNDYKLLTEIDKENKTLQSWINYREGKYSISVLQARDAISEMDKKPDFSDSIYKLAYPLHYQETINERAKEYRLDPYLVTALIREESYFNPEAGSSAGARGLMQLMPSTAYYIANRNGIGYTGSKALLNPEKNIELGCAYLDYAKERLYENDLFAVASYNGGPDAVRSWKKNLTYKNFDEFIESIPYPETRDYVKKVYRSYWVYINIY